MQCVLTEPAGLGGPGGQQTVRANQRCVLMQGQPAPFRAASGRVRQWIEGGDPATLLTAGERQLGCWAQCWAPQYRRESGLLESPAQSHKGDEGPGASFIWSEAERAGAAWPGEEKVQGSLTHVDKHLMGGSKEDGTTLLPKSGHSNPTQ